MIGKIKSFLKESTAELKKVSWSSRQELIGATLVVLASTAVLALFIFIIDTAVARAITLVLK
ncbi:MAG: preprotein translocase subunit SecE [Candidatus Omnitrophota bacterium]